MGHRSGVSTRKGGGFYGYRIHASVCTATDLPVAWTVATAREHESLFVAGLLDTVKARGFGAETCALDKGYDNNRVYGECADHGCVPIIPLRETPDVQRGEHKPPTCEHGAWRFAGSDSKRGAIVAGPPLSASLDGSRTSGRSHPSASVDWIGSGCMPT